MKEKYYSEAMLEIDQNIIRDFYTEFNDTYDTLIHALNALEDSQDPELINSVFRGVHSIKSNLRMVGLTALSEAVHHLETILEQIRKKQYPYIVEYGDIIKLVLDEARVSAEKYFHKEPLSKELAFIPNAIKNITETHNEEREEAIIIALELLDPFKKGKHKAEEEIKAIEKEIENHSQEQSSTKSNYPYMQEDLDFFKDIFAIIKKRIKSPTGKMELVNTVALKMNELSDFKVDHIQLQAAIYIFNWGLCALPKPLLEKEELNEAEISTIHECQLQAVNLLHSLPFWDQARTIVAQCHEHVNGLGYPNHLRKDEICDGAKILAIANAFGAIFYKQLSTAKSNPRVMMSALLTINDEADQQFDGYWTDLFNKAIKDLYKGKKFL